MITAIVKFEGVRKTTRQNIGLLCLTISDDHLRKTRLFIIGTK